MTQRARGGFTIEESARRLGNYRWASIRLFETLGSWVAEVPEPDIKVWLAAASRHHGWHAELLEERLPEVRELHPDKQTAPATAEVGAVFDRVAAISGPGCTIERLVAVYRVVLPHIVAVQSWHLDRCTPVADGAVARTLGFVLADQVADWQRAEQYLQALISDPTALDRASEIRLSLERDLVASGGISGPTSMVDLLDAAGRSSSGPADVDVRG